MTLDEFARHVFGDEVDDVKTFTHSFTYDVEALTWAMATGCSVPVHTPLRNSIPRPR